MEPLSAAFHLRPDVTILNSAPTASVTLTENVTSLGPLNAVITSDDADEEEVQTSIQWYRNGFLDGTLMNVTSVPASYLGPGQTWSIHVTPTDESLLSGATVRLLDYDPQH
jgi:hypothetical protein